MRDSKITIRPLLRAYACGLVMAIILVSLSSAIVTRAEVVVSSIDLVVDDLEAAAGLRWRECSFSLAGIHDANDTRDLAHDGYWIEIPLATDTGGYGEIDLLFLDEGVHFRDLVNTDSIPMDRIQRIPFRGNSGFKLDVSHAVSARLAAGRSNFRVAIGRLDVGSLGVIQLFPGDGVPSGRIIAIQAK